MIRVIKGRTGSKTTYHCDICGKEGVVSQVLGRDIDLCQWPCWPKTADMDYSQLTEYIKENKHGHRRKSRGSNDRHND